MLWQKPVSKHDHRMRYRHNKRWRVIARSGERHSARRLDCHYPRQIAGRQCDRACSNRLAAEYGLDPQRGVGHVDPLYGASVCGFGPTGVSERLSAMRPRIRLRCV